MTKTKLERTLEKQNRERRRETMKANNMKIAESLVNSQPIINGIKIMDEDAEAFLDAILDQYDGNENNHVGFKSDLLPRPLIESSAVQYEKLKMYGMISSVIQYGNGGGIITLSEIAKTYKGRKEEAVRKVKEEEEKREQLETDYYKIQKMSAEDLRNIYLQAIAMNGTLKDSLSVQDKQLQVLKNLFASSEDGVDVQKVIMSRLIEQEEEKHQIRDVLVDKVGDLGVEAIKAAMPVILITIRAVLAENGIIIP